MISYLGKQIFLKLGNMPSQCNGLCLGSERSPSLKMVLSKSQNVYFRRTHLIEAHIFKPKLIPSQLMEKTMKLFFIYFLFFIFFSKPLPLKSVFNDFFEIQFSSIHFNLPFLLLLKQLWSNSKVNFWKNLALMVVVRTFQFSLGPSHQHKLFRNG